MVCRVPLGLPTSESPDRERLVLHHQWVVGDGSGGQQCLILVLQLPPNLRGALIDFERKSAHLPAGPRASLSAQAATVSAEGQGPLFFSVRAVLPLPA